MFHKYTHVFIGGNWWHFGASNRALILADDVQTSKPSTSKTQCLIWNEQIHVTKVRTQKEGQCRAWSYHSRVCKVFFGHSASWGLHPVQAHAFWNGLADFENQISIVIDVARDDTTGSASSEANIWPRRWFPFFKYPEQFVDSVWKNLEKVSFAFWKGLKTPSSQILVVSENFVTAWSKKRNIWKRDRKMKKENVRPKEKKGNVEERNAGYPSIDSYKEKKCHLNTTMILALGVFYIRVQST